MGDFDEHRAIQEVTHKLGTAPRGLLKKFFLERKYFRRRKPGWLHEGDLLSKIFEHEKDILARGEVRWASVIHANQSVYKPGKGESGAQVIYSPSDRATLNALLEAAGNAFALKGTQPEDPAERLLADMLTDEMERALDWQVPTTLSNGLELITTIVMTPRVFMPGGVLAVNFFPILADPETMMAVMVPDSFWPSDFRALWKQRAVASIASQKQERRIRLEEIRELLKDPKEATSFVRLTSRACDQVRKIMRESEMSQDETCLRIGGNAGTHTMEFSSKHELRKSDVTFDAEGITVVVDIEDLFELEGTELDFLTKGGQTGFVFNR